MKLSLRTLPVPVLFVAGAAFGVLAASLIVFGTHAEPSVVATNAMIRPAALPFAAPEPMFDTPPMVEPASLSAPARPAAPTAKKAVTRNNVRRHRPAAKQVATGDLLTAAL